MQLFNAKSNFTMPAPADNGNCYFLAHSRNRSSLVQLINVHSFSVLIDSGQGGYNLSAYIGCLGMGSKNVSVQLGFLKDNNLLTDQHKGDACLVSIEEKNIVLLPYYIF
jgi:hypothetical protein